MKKGFVRQFLAFVILGSVSTGAAGGALASSSTGQIESVIVGRAGNQVIFQVSNQSGSFPCPAHPNGLNYYFLLDQPGGEAQLSALLTAYASGRTVLVAGTGLCDLSGMPEVEGVSHLWLTSQ